MTSSYLDKPRPAPQRYRISYHGDRADETFLAHNVNRPPAGSSFSMHEQPDRLLTVFREIDGRWTLLHAVDVRHVREIRNLDAEADPKRPGPLRRAWRWLFADTVPNAERGTR